jgi:hypothetical protein
VAEYCGHVTVRAYVDGKEMGHQSRPVPTKDARNPVAATIGRVGLTPENLARVEAAIAEEEAILATTPEYLDGRRQGLLRDLSDALHLVDAAGRHRIERAIATGVDGGPVADEYTARAESARAALATFDAAHRDVAARAAEQRAACAERHQWN